MRPNLPGFAYRFLAVDTGTTTCSLDRGATPLRCPSQKILTQVLQKVGREGLRAALNPCGFVLTPKAELSTTPTPTPTPTKSCPMLLMTGSCCLQHSRTVWVYYLLRIKLKGIL